MIELSEFIRNRLKIYTATTFAFSIFMHGSAIAQESATTFMVDSMENGTVVTCDLIPLHISGSYAGNLDPVYVLLTDIYGRYYIQAPKVEFFSDTWLSTNVRPGLDIISIRFYQADKEADRFFAERISQNKWGGFEATELPPGANLLTMISIERSEQRC